MKRDRFDLISQHCADLGIPVDWEDLGSKRRGKCQALTGRITLNPRLTLAQAASTLAHEVGHWTFGDTRSTLAAESRAWEYGASLVLEPQEYAVAEACVGHHTSALAIELGVTPKLIESWRRWWRRQGHQRYEMPTEIG